MKSLKNILTLFLITSFLFHCASSPKLEKKAPEVFGEAYFQGWNSGMQGGGSGINIHIKTKGSLIVLDSVYFRGKVVKLERNSATSSYVGHYTSKYDNKNSKIPIANFPYKLKENECVVSYISENNILYFKISNLIEKQVLNYPRALSNK